MGLNLEDRVRKHFRKILLTSAFLITFNCGEEKSPTAPPMPPTENSPPTVEITSGPSGTINQNYATFSWRGSDTDGQVIRYYRDLDDSTPDIETTETSFTFTNLNDGNHAFYVKAEDNDNAFSPIAQRSFRVETSPGGEQEIQAGTSNSNGIVDFSNTSVTVINKNTRQPIQGINVTYYNYDNAKVFVSESPDESYFPAMDLYTHNSDHTLELTPRGTLDFIVEEITGESLTSFENFLGFITTNANCQSGPNITFNGTVTGDQFYSYNHTLGGLVLVVLNAMTGVPFPRIISTLENIGIEMRDAITGVDLRSTNWDKYIRTDPPSLISQYIYIPSNAPSISQYPPEVSGNTVTLIFAAFDSWTYPPPYSSITDATIECSGPTQGNDLSYWFKISDSPYSNWTPTSEPTITVTNLSEGAHWAQGRVKDDTNINEDISEEMTFIITGGGGGLEILAQFDFDVVQHGNIYGIAWDNPNPLLGGSYRTVYVTYPDYNLNNLIIINAPQVPYFIDGLDQNPWSNHLWSCYEDKIYEHETNISSIKNTFNSPENMASTYDLAWVTSSSLFVCGTGNTPYELYLVNPNNNMSIIKRENSPNNEQPVGAAYDGEYIWIVTYEGNIYPLDPTTLKQVGSQKYDAPSNYPSDLAPGVSSLWYSDELAEIYEIRVP